MPTLKAYLGLEYQDDTHGKSYHAVFDGHHLEDRTLYCDATTNSLKKVKDYDALVKDRYKLVVRGARNEKEKTRYKLFHITDDPGETVNLEKKLKHLVKKLFKEIAGIRKDLGRRLKRNKKANGRLLQGKTWSQYPISYAIPEYG